MTVKTSIEHEVGTRVPTYDGDMVSPDARCDPFPLYRELRDLGPVVRLGHPDGYAIGRFRDVQQAFSVPAILGSIRGLGFNDIVTMPMARPPVIRSDGEGHRRLGRVMTGSSQSAGEAR